MKLCPLPLPRLNPCRVSVRDWRKQVREKCPCFPQVQQVGRKFLPCLSGGKVRRCGVGFLFKAAISSVRDATCSSKSLVTFFCPSSSSSWNSRSLVSVCSSTLLAAAKRVSRVSGGVDEQMVAFLMWRLSPPPKKTKRSVFTALLKSALALSTASTR